jgi:hypothetical protein
MGLYGTASCEENKKRKAAMRKNDAAHEKAWSQSVHVHPLARGV